MKKIFVLLLVALTLLFAVSCDGDSNTGGSDAQVPKEPESASEVMDKITETMGALSSYETELNGELRYYVDGGLVEMIVTGKGYESGIGSVDYRFYADEKLVVNMYSLSVSEIVLSRRAYIDGKCFVYDSTPTSLRKLCSSMSVDEFADFIDGDSFDFLDYSECANKSFQKNEDGGWTVNYAGYSKKTVNKLEGLLGTDEQTVGSEILDMEITFVADAEFRLTEVEANVMYEQPADKSKTPTFVVSTSYGKYNNADTSESVNKNEYTEVDDLKVIGEIADMIEAYGENKEGRFSVKNEVKSDQTLIYLENYQASYGVDNSGYTYEINSEVNGEKVDVKYTNGVVTITYEDSVQQALQTPEQAKQSINGLINSAKYGELRASDIKKVEEGVYEITCKSVDAALYETQLRALGLTCDFANPQKITVTVKNGEITEIHSEVYVIARKGSIVYDLLVCSTVTFLEVEGIV